MARAACGSVAVRSCGHLRSVQVDHHVAAESDEISEKPRNLEGYRVFSLLVDNMLQCCYNTFLTGAMHDQS